MTNPTSNYGFVLPTATDLVTDLPADFEVALQGVDTRLKALQPGTTLGDIAYSSATANVNTRLGVGTNGQVLAVSGGVPAWTTTADVTPLTTKGDLFTFDTADARLGVGTNGQYLQADSTAATGLKWATVSTSPTFVGCSLQKATQSIATGTWVALTWNVETNDSNAFHDNTTNNSRVTIPSGYAGRYLIATTICYDQSGGTGARYIGVYKNGGSVSLTATGIPGNVAVTGTFSMTYTEIVNCSVADYLEIYGYQSSGGALGVLGNASGAGISNFNVTYLGA